MWFVRSFCLFLRTWNRSSFFLVLAGKISSAAPNIGVGAIGVVPTFLATKIQEIATLPMHPTLLTLRRQRPSLPPMKSISWLSCSVGLIGIVLESAAQISRIIMGMVKIAIPNQPMHATPCLIARHPPLPSQYPTHSAQYS
jgi:hypothetical protein